MVQKTETRIFFASFEAAGQHHNTAMKWIIIWNISYGITIGAGDDAFFYVSRVQFQFCRHDLSWQCTSISQLPLFEIRWISFEWITILISSMKTQLDHS